MTQVADYPNRQSSPPWTLKRYRGLGIAAIAALSIVGVGAAVRMRGLQPAIDIDTLTVPVESQAITLRITASGTVQPVNSVNLSPKTAGILAELLVEQGDMVEAGEAIAFMESNDEAAEVSRTQASLAAAEARLAEVRAGNRPEDIAQAQSRVMQADARVSDAQVRLQLAEDRVERNQTLAQEGAISADSLDAVVNEAEVLRGNVGVAAGVVAGGSG